MPESCAHCPSYAQRNATLRNALVLTRDALKADATPEQRQAAAEAANKALSEPRHNEAHHG
jgi:hypothetical protein